MKKTAKHEAKEAHEEHPKAVEHPFPEEAEQENRLKNLVEAVKEAFRSNQFAEPGDLEIQIRGMANTLPHHAPSPESVERAA